MILQWTACSIPWGSVRSPVPSGTRKFVFLSESESLPAMSTLLMSLLKAVLAVTWPNGREKTELLWEGSSFSITATNTDPLGPGLILLPPYSSLLLLQVPSWVWCWSSHAATNCGCVPKMAIRNILWQQNCAQVPLSVPNNPILDSSAQGG